MVQVVKNKSLMQNIQNLKMSLNLYLKVEELNYAACIILKRTDWFSSRADCHVHHSQ